MYLNKEYFRPLLSDSLVLSGITFSTLKPNRYFRSCYYYFSIDNHRFDIQVFSKETEIIVGVILYGLPKSYQEQVQQVLQLFEKCLQTEAENHPRLRLVVLTGVFRIKIKDPWRD